MLVKKETQKACPVVLKKTADETRILCFQHPLAGIQIVKGTVEENESVDEACVRELFEESGLQASINRFLGFWRSGYENQTWGFYLMNVAEDLPEKWMHFTQDDGGHWFQFFWHPIDRPLAEPHHWVFERARLFVLEKV